MAKDDAKNRPFEIGYGKPPKSGQFRKGRSGNPRGRPKGMRNTKTLLDEALNKEITISEGGKTSRVTKKEALIVSLVTNGIKGSHQATGHILKLIERFEEVESANEERMTIHVIDQFIDPE